MLVMKTSLKRLSKTSYSGDDTKRRHPKQQNKPHLLSDNHQRFKTVNDFLRILGHSSGTCWFGGRTKLRNGPSLTVVAQLEYRSMICDYLKHPERKLKSVIS
ncbi:hypothetical protein YC2023_020865 [Brassica napus]